MTNYFLEAGQGRFVPLCPVKILLSSQKFVDLAFQFISIHAMDNCCFRQCLCLSGGASNAVHTSPHQNWGNIGIYLKQFTDLSYLWKSVSCSSLLFLMKLALNRVLSYYNTFFPRNQQESADWKEKR